MSTRTHIPALLLALMFLATAGPALGEITLVTDKPVYEIGEIVHITAHNAGPTDEEFNSAPFFLIYNADTDQCITGCLGLPVITPFPVGETVSLDWDTGDGPDVPGNYTIGIAVFDGPIATYVLTDDVSAEECGWGALKALFR